MLAEFKKLVQKSPIPFDEAAWQKDLEFIRAMIHCEIDIDLFGVAAAYKNLAKPRSAAAVRPDAVPRGPAAARHDAGRATAVAAQRADASLVA